MASSKIRWNGTTEDGRTTTIIWGNNPYTWGDVTLALELVGVGGSSPAKRKARLEKLLQKEPEKKKRLIHLICRIKGEKVYDEKKEVGEVEIKLEDVDMVINEILGKIKVETKDVL
tara:strand:- start:35 stop:382 length:348 start_codon:yes stop_codon:yes gene_type:complete